MIEKFCYAQIKVASHVDVLRGSSRVPAPLTSAESSGKKRRLISAHFQIWEVHFGPWEILRETRLQKMVLGPTTPYRESIEK